MADTDERLVPDTSINEIPLQRKFYFNGFTLSLTATDVLINFAREGHIILSGTTSYTTAKTMAIQLASLVELLENKIGVKVLTFEEMTEAISKEVGEASLTREIDVKE